MARIRTIKPEFWSDEKLAPREPVTRLLFLALISMADDMGRLIDNVKQIDAFAFPETDDSSAEGLEQLASLGRIRRGVTRSGQRVIQIKNWHHQRIDKPNLASALPPIEGDPDDESVLYRQRKRVPRHLKDAVWARDKSTCRACGKTPLRREKRDKYDSDPDLGEVDHHREAADGGEPKLSNLRLLCLPCNRKKAGVAVRERSEKRKANDQRRLQDASGSNPGNIRDTSGTDRRPIPTTYDLRPTTEDLGSTTEDPRDVDDDSEELVADTFGVDSPIWESFDVEVSATERRALAPFFSRVETRAVSWVAWLNGTLNGQGMPGMKPASMADIVVGLQEFMLTGTGEPKPPVLSRFIDLARKRRLDAGDSAPLPTGAAAESVVDRAKWLCTEVKRTGIHRWLSHQWDDRWRMAQPYMADPDRLRAEWQVLGAEITDFMRQDRKEGDLLRFLVPLVSQHGAPALVREATA